MTNPPVDDRFAQLSQVLTGFGPKTIGDALKGEFDYVQVLRDRAGPEATEALLARFQQLKNTGKSDREIAYAVLTLSDPNVAGLARAMMKLWYLGLWFQPFDYKSYKTGGVPVIVDPLAYANSLAGRSAQAKPVGTTEPNSAAGLWAKQPPALEEFIG
jgi:hypothetical protein